MPLFKKGVSSSSSSLSSINIVALVQVAIKTSLQPQSFCQLFTENKQKSKQIFGAFLTAPPFSGYFLKKQTQRRKTPTLSHVHSYTQTNSQM